LCIVAPSVCMKISRPRLVCSIAYPRRSAVPCLLRSVRVSGKVRIFTAPEPFESFRGVDRKSRIG